MKITVNGIVFQDPESLDIQVDMEGKDASLPPTSANVTNGSLSVHASQIVHTGSIHFSFMNPAPKPFLKGGHAVGG